MNQNLNHLTQEGKVLRVLKARGERGLSGVEAEDMLRVRDLPKRISVLKQRGVPITRELRRDELGQRYARYFYAGAVA